MDLLTPHTSPSGPVLLCVTPFVPHAGIDHAGGAFLHRYLGEALRLGWSVRLLAPATPANRGAAGRLLDDVELTLYDAPDGLARKVAHSLVTGVPAETGRAWLRRLPPAARQWLADSDVVDLQWSDSIWNATALAATFPGIVMVGLAHDVRTESLRRGVRRGRKQARAEALLAIARVAGQERDHVNQLRQVSVFKNEDRELLRELGVTVPIGIVPVLTSDPSAYPPPRLDSRRVLFAAAFHRPENVEAAEWLLEAVLPLVRRAVPDVRVRLAGSRPPARLVDRAGPAVEVTGYLPRLETSYEDVACVAVPLRRGAGVKFKTVEAVRAGFPVVTTSVGAEGVAAAAGRPPDATCDDAESFAAAVVRALCEPAAPRPPAADGAGASERVLREHFEGLRRLVAERADR